MESIKISDGVTLNIIETDKFKTNYLSFNFIVPLDREKASVNALLPQVLLRGTKYHKDQASLKNALDDLYASSIEARIYKKGDYQLCGITAEWISDKYSVDGTEITDGTLDILEEVLFYPYTENGVFADKYVESEKAILIDDIRALINNKTSYAVRRCKEEMCKDEPFGICEYGDENSVNKITAGSLYDAYTDLLSNSMIEIFYIGSDLKDKLCSKIYAMFKTFHRNYSGMTKSIVKRTVDEKKEIIEKSPVTQGKLSLGFRLQNVLGEPMHEVFSLLYEMYGNSPVSKLFMNVREKLSLCYYCRVIPEGLKGIMIVTSGIEVDNRQKAQEEILYQLECIKRGDFTDEELELAKKSLKNAYNELKDTPSSLEGWYLTRRLAGLSDDPMDVCDMIMKYTRDDIINFARMIELDTVYFLEGTLKGDEDNEDE